MTTPTATQLAAQVKKLTAKLNLLESALAADKSSYKIGDFLGKFGSAPGQFSEERLSAIDESLRKITAQGQHFAKGGKLNEALDAVAFKFDKFAGSADLGAKAFEALATGFEKFAILAEANFGPGKTGVKLTTQLAEQAAALDRLGLGFGEYNKNLDLAVNMFNLTEDKVKGLNSHLHAFAAEIKMLPSVVSSNFQLVAKALAYEAPKVLDQFKKMQKLSQETGVSTGQLLSGFGEKMDTISGASQFAGQFNAILGGNWITPNELFMMDEAERMVAIRRILQQHPIYDEIKSGSRLGKYALLTASKVVGYDKETFRKYLFGKSGERTLKTALARDIGPHGTGRSATAEVEAERGALAKAGTDAALQNETERLTRMIKNAFLGSQDRALVEERARYMGTTALTTDIRGDTLAAAELAATINYSPGELENMLGPNDTNSGKNVARAIARSAQFNELVAKAQTLPQDDKTMGFFNKLQAIANIISAPKVNQRQAQKAQTMIMELLKNAETLAIPYREQGEITLQERILLNNLVPTKFGLKRKFIRIFRSEDITQDTFGARLEKEIEAAEKAIDASGLPATQKDALKKSLRGKDASQVETPTTPGTKPGPQPVTPPAAPKAPKAKPTPTGPKTPPSGPQGPVAASDLISAFKGVKFYLQIGKKAAEDIVDLGIADVVIT